MELIPNWQDQDLTCAFCGTKKSVKYIIDTLSVEEQTNKVCACNKCALLFSERGK